MLRCTVIFVLLVLFVLFILVLVSVRRFAFKIIGRWRSIVADISSTDVPHDFSRFPVLNLDGISDIDRHEKTMMRRQQHTHCKYRNQQHPIMYSVSSLLLLSISVLLLNDVPYSRTHCSAFTVQVPIASSSSSRWNKNNHHHHQHQFRKSLLLASVVPDVTATTSPTNSSIESSSWIQNGIEQKLTNGLSSLSNRITNAVIGPGKVLIYDTTLRGKNEQYIE